MIIMEFSKHVIFFFLKRGKENSLFGYHKIHLVHNKYKKEIKRKKEKIFTI